MRKQPFFSINFHLGVDQITYRKIKLSFITYQASSSQKLLSKYFFKNFWGWFQINTEGNLTMVRRDILEINHRS